MVVPLFRPGRAESSVAALHDFHGDAGGFPGPGAEAGAAVALVRSHVPKARRGISGPGEQHHGTIATADAGRAHADHQSSATGVDEQVTLDAAGLLAAVVSMQATAFAGPDTPAVHDGGAGSGITAELHPLAFAQRRQHPLPHAFLLPLPPWQTVCHGGRSCAAVSRHGRPAAGTPARRGSPTPDQKDPSSNGNAARTPQLPKVRRHPATRQLVRGQAFQTPCGSNSTNRQITKTFRDRRPPTVAAAKCRCLAWSWLAWPRLR